MPELSKLTTPCLLLNQTRLRKNIARATDKARSLGVSLRPHLKTTKSLDICRLILEEGWSDVSVSSLPEVALAIEAGARNIRYTSPFAPNKLEMVQSILPETVAFEILLDSPQAIRSIEDKAEALGMRVGVVVEVDADGNRAGVTLSRLDAICEVLAQARSIYCAGVYGYTGASYRLPKFEDRLDLLDRHIDALEDAVTRLEQSGVHCSAVGLGGSPALLTAKAARSLTEISAGVFLFQDLAQAGIGSADMTDLAVGVMATVTQHKPEGERIFIDAGGLALSQDRSTANQTLDQGYGLVLDPVSWEPLGAGDIVVAQTSQEHGMLRRRDGSPAPTEILPVGQRVLVLPNHVCMMAAAHGHYHVLNDAAEPIARWSRVTGWTI